MYPPQASDKCTGEVDAHGIPLDVVGGGTCGVNGNMKIFSVDQSTSDCDGGLAGVFSSGAQEFTTESHVNDDESILF